jgi:hypothetical protein
MAMTLGDLVAHLRLNGVGFAVTKLKFGPVVSALEVDRMIISDQGRNSHRRESGHEIEPQPRTQPQYGELMYL